jgi:hypothetical protein
MAPKKGKIANVLPLLFLLFLIRDPPWDGKNQDPGFGDKHPGSATLLGSQY